MKICENCGKEQQGTYGSGRFCSSKCARGFSTKAKRKEINAKVSKAIHENAHPAVKKICPQCKKIFIVPWNGRDKICCSVSCARKNRKKKIYSCICKNCGKEFTCEYRKRRKCCSKECLSNIYRISGLKSAELQSKSRRSKNEIYFANLCIQNFIKVLTNEQMFNGWDADIIIEDIKVAVLWNGKWHYEKINKKHSVEQVQNRDKIKIKQIKDMGYIPYIIKDMGRYDKMFVEKEFNKFIKWRVSSVGRALES